MLRLRWCTALVLLLAGCDDDAHASLFVDLRTDFVPVVEFATVEVEHAGRPFEEGGEVRSVDAVADAALDYGAAVRVADIDGLASPGTRYLRVSLLDERRAVLVSRSAVIQLSGDTAVTITLARSCQAVECPGPTDEGVWSTCVVGRCDDPRCTSTARESCRDPVCAVDAECATSGCIRGLCAIEGCLAVPDDALCAAGERCDPTGACVVDVPTDAGGGDAGATDAGMDAGLVDAGPGATLVGLSAGDEHTCAIVAGGDVYCWGGNGAGQLGTAMTGADTHMPARMMTTAPVIDVSSGYRFDGVASRIAHTCMVTAANAVQCTGHNARGQLGTGDTTDRGRDVAVVGASPARRVSAGADSSCALTLPGAVECWGANDFGQLGNGTRMQRTTATMIFGFAADAIDVGDRFACATLGGAVACWGRNDSGQLGDGTTIDQSAPNALGTLAGVVGITAGEDHACAWDIAGAWCWGIPDARLGLGGGMPTDGGRSPSAVALPAAPAELLAGSRHTCARLVDGRTVCWGYNFEGQLGDGTMGMVVDPPAALVLPNVTELAPGGFHSCFATADGAVRCAGANWAGQVGDGTFGTMRVTSFSTVTGLP